MTWKFQATGTNLHFKLLIILIKTYFLWFEIERYQRPHQRKAVVPYGRVDTFCENKNQFKNLDSLKLL